MSVVPLRMSPCPLYRGTGKQGDLDCGLCHGKGERDTEASSNAESHALQFRAYRRQLDHRRLHKRPGPWGLYNGAGNAKS